MLTWHGWRYGGLFADQTWMEFVWCVADLERMEVKWSVSFPGMDGGWVVCVLTWHGCRCGSVSADLAWMNVVWSVC